MLRPTTPHPRRSASLHGCLPLLAALFGGSAAATPSFDPKTTAATWDDTTNVVLDAAGLPLWDRVERLDDGDPVLFPAELFAEGSAWDDTDPYAPHVETAFGGSEPSPGAFLLHFAPGWAQAEHPVPVILVPGAASSASGVFPVLARAFASDGRSVFGLTFAHPHGDNFQQAEVIADAILRVRELTGADQVDLVAHSKGGIAAALYLAHGAAQDWGEGRGSTYAARGTPYRGDVRRLLTVGTPWGGLDTGFRWTAPHLAQAQGGPLLVPQAWSHYYPFTTGNLLVVDDLLGIDLWPDGGNPFPGQAQLLARWDGTYALPGGRTDLAAYALQQDWWTTYEGGLGVVSDARGIDSAMAAGGDVIARLAARGLDPGVGLITVAGTRPVVPLDRNLVPTEPFGGEWAEFLGQDPSWYGEFVRTVLAGEFPGLQLGTGEAAGLAAGAVILGEISGLSDGLVFTASAESTSGACSRGAPLLAAARFDLSHLDLLFASPAVGAVLMAEAEGHPELLWSQELGARYAAEDSVGWIVAALADGAEGDDDDDTGTPGDDDSATWGDDDSDGDDDSADEDATLPPDAFEGCGCAHTTPSPALGSWPLLALCSLRRRRR